MLGDKKKEKYRTTVHRPLFLFLWEVYLFTRDIKGFFFCVLFSLSDWRERAFTGADVYTRSFALLIFYFCLTLLLSLSFFAFNFLCRCCCCVGERGRREEGLGCMNVVIVAERGMK